jgi:hypothetical protein
MALAGSTPNTINTKAPDMTLNMPTAFLLLADGLDKEQRPTSKPETYFHFFAIRCLTPSHLWTPSHQSAD